MSQNVRRAELRHLHKDLCFRVAPIYADIAEMGLEEERAYRLGLLRAVQAIDRVFLRLAAPLRKPSKHGPRIG